MTTNYGRYHTLLRNDFGFIAPGQLRGVTFNATTQHLWAYELGAWVGKNTLQSASNVTMRIGLYDTDGSMNPAARLGYSASMAVSTVMTFAGEGAAHAAAVEASTGPLATAIPLTSGRRYHLAFLGTVGYLGFGMAEAADITADNEKFYSRSGLSQPPPDPFGAYSSSNEGHIVIWAVCDENVAPNTPTGLSPAGTINETAPTFAALFRDQNAGYSGGTDRGDYLNQYKIQVRRQSDGLTFWDTTISASSPERSAEAVSRAYGGTTLVRGTTYEWRIQMSDHFGTWSAWTAWTAFTPANLGFVTLNGTPTGKTEDNTPDFQGRWNHQTAAAMTRVQVRILNGAGNTVLQTGADYDIADVASSAAPGTLFTVVWANTGLSTLAWGTSYQYQVRGKDSTLWSDWSAPRAFSTDAAPSIPANLTPGNSAILTAYPLLQCTATDADDTTGTGFVVKARIKNNAGSVLFTRSMTYNAVNGKWEYQTTGTDLASYATYRWDAYSGDGTLWSGEQTVEANATKSAEATFVYALGPTVTITSPTEGATITTSNLPVTWTTVGQVKFRVYLYEDGGTIPIYDSGQVTSGTGSHTIPSGYLLNDSPYDLVVWVEDGTPLTGQSAIRNIAVDYVDPDPVPNFAGDAIKVTTDIWASAIRLTWDQTAYGTNVWQDYTLWRSASGGPDAAAVIRARITSPLVVSYTDYTPASGYEYTYWITQTILTGLDTLTSAPVMAVVSVSLGGIVISSVTSPDTLRTSMRYTNERDHGRKIDEAVYQPLSGALSTTVRARQRVPLPRFDAKVFDDDGATAATRRDELEALDASHHTLCIRDNHGRKQFVTMTDCGITDQVPDWYTAKLSLRAERYREGVS